MLENVSSFSPACGSRHAKHHIKGTAVSLRHRSTPLSKNVIREAFLFPACSDGVFARQCYVELSCHGLAGPRVHIPPVAFSGRLRKLHKHRQQVVDNLDRGLFLHLAGPQPGLVAAELVLLRRG